MTTPVLTVDGPSGAGKGTVSRLLAQTLGWHYLDSGAIYRALAIAIAQKTIASDDIQQIVDVAEGMVLHFECGDQRHVLLDGEDITTLLGLESTGNMASKIAVIPQVREALLKKQQCFKQAPGLVADGRDTPYKVYLTASAQTRAQRRYKQLKEKGICANLIEITADIQERDQRDSARDIAPLIAAADAVYIDSSTMSIQAVVEKVLSMVY
jgi:cytidylate kinase